MNCIAFAQLAIGLYGIKSEKSGICVRLRFADYVIREAALCGGEIGANLDYLAAVGCPKNTIIADLTDGYYSTYN